MLPLFSPCRLFALFQAAPLMSPPATLEAWVAVTVRVKVAHLRKHVLFFISGWLVT